MFSGQSEYDVKRIICKGGYLYKKYANKKRLMAFVYADIDKNRSSNLVRQFFSQIHYTSGVDMDFFWIGYRSEGEFSKEDEKLLNKVSEIKITNSEKSIPEYFESEVFHRHNNFYLTENKWNEKLNNSSFYMVFYEVYDGNPNLDNAYVVNFIKESLALDEEFMNDFVTILRSSLSENNQDISMIEKLLSSETINKYKNRLFKVIKTSAKLMLESVILHNNVL